MNFILIPQVMELSEVLSYVSNFWMEI